MLQLHGFTANQITAHPQNLSTGNHQQVREIKRVSYQLSHKSIVIFYYTKKKL